MNIKNKPRVVRGGSWDYYRVCARASYRSHSSPVVRLNAVGFRLALRRCYEHKK